MASVNVMRKQSSLAKAGTKMQFDYWLLLAVAALLVVGMLAVYSVTFDYGFLYKDDTSYYFQRQFISLLLGLASMVVIMQFDYHVFRKVSVPLLIFTLVSLFIILFLGESILGAKRGILGGSYQPSELAKLAIILYISHWLSSKGDRIKMLTYGLVPFSVITGVVTALIVLQPDLSTATLVALVSFTLFFVAGADWRQFAVAGAVGGAIFLLLINTLPHAAARMTEYRIVLDDPTQAGWHVQQALIALGRGGWSGVGIGQSVQKFGPLPMAHTDGVFAILAEEVGLMGALTVIGLYVMFAWRGIRTAQTARDSYGSLLALGITFWLSYQALINIAVITALIPFTGMPLPFLSYGGSSLLISLLGVGILLNISRDATMNKRTQRNE